MLNHITIMGRLTRDPELRRTQNGTAVAGFTLAVDRDYTSKDGGAQETDFIDCVAWRSTAEFASKYFSKGRMAVVSGRAEIIVGSMYFGDSKRDADSASGNNSADSAVSNGYQPYADDFDELGNDDDQLPF